MLYAILCYHDEDVVCAWSKEEDEAVMARLGAVSPTSSPGPASSGRRCASCRPPRRRRCARATSPLVIDGPFAETKEQLLGFYVVDVADLDEALDVARELAAANPGGAYEIRPDLAAMPESRSGPTAETHPG